MSLPEFMLTGHYKELRRHKRKTQWSERDLWLAVALAACRRAQRAPTGTQLPLMPARSSAPRR